MEIFVHVTEKIRECSFSRAAEKFHPGFSYRLRELYSPKKLGDRHRALLFKRLVESYGDSYWYAKSINDEETRGVVVVVGMNESSQSLCVTTTPKGLLHTAKVVNGSA
jgi:hypothetical protein